MWVIHKKYSSYAEIFVNVDAFVSHTPMRMEMRQRKIQSKFNMKYNYKNKNSYFNCCQLFCESSGIRLFASAANSESCAFELSLVAEYFPIECVQDVPPATCVLEKFKSTLAHRTSEFFFSNNWEPRSFTLKRILHTCNAFHPAFEFF